MTSFTDRLERLVFLTPPACQGQTVESSYAADPEGLVLRIYDRSDLTTSYAVTPWPTDDGFRFEPQNSEPNVSDWRFVDAAGRRSLESTEDEEATEAARVAFVGRLPSIGDAIAFEHTTLGCGREFLPADALVVLDGGASTVGYYHWLEQQLDASEEGQRQSESV